jgi:mono/diheme cytochrome c family protein
VGIVALSSTAVIFLVLGAIVAVGFASALIWLALRRRPAAKPDIPSGMRPGPADEVLERRLIERFIGWNLVFVIFFAAWLPVVWFLEPSTNASDAVALTEESVQRGESWFAISDSSNPTGFGCARCHGPEGAGGQTVPFMDGFVNPPPLNDVCGGETTGHPLIKSLDDIRATIEEGREGTPMPSWSVEFEGAMNDQQIDDLLNYIITIQKEIPEKENVCINPVTEEDGGESPTPGPTDDGAETS